MVSTLDTEEQILAALSAATASRASAEADAAKVRSFGGVPKTVRIGETDRFRRANVCFGLEKLVSGYVGACSRGLYSCHPKPAVVWP